MNNDLIKPIQINLDSWILIKTEKKFLIHQELTRYEHTKNKVALHESIPVIGAFLDFQMVNQSMSRRIVRPWLRKNKFFGVNTFEILKKVVE